MLKAYNHQLVDEIKENERTIIKTMGRCWKEISLVHNGSYVTILIQDWQGNPLPYEPVNIRITGKMADGTALTPFESICVDGTIELDVYQPGDQLLIETLNENVENTRLEVVV